MISAPNYRLFAIALLFAWTVFGQFRPSLPGRRSNDATQETKAVDASGKVETADGKMIVIYCPDTRFLSFKIGPKTAMTKAGQPVKESLERGTPVHIVGTEDDQGFFTADSIGIEGAPSADKPDTDIKASEDSSNDETHSFVFSAPGPDGPERTPSRPRLRRGKPTPGENSGADDVEGDPERPKTQPKPVAAEQPADPHKVLIDKTKEWAADFSHSLPNYLCQQLTTRYQRVDKITGWRPVDVVEANVAFENGEEKYQNISINGRKVNKSIMAIGGSTSQGEFGSTLQGLFAPQTRAKFTFYRTELWHGIEAQIFDFEVKRQTSDMEVTVASQKIIPAYQGSVWIEPKTARVLRIEKQALQIPKAFPLASFEWGVDYGPVRLNTKEYWMPTGAENLSCYRDSGSCSKNSTNFRAYRAFGSESTVTFDDK